MFRHRHLLPLLLSLLALPALADGTDPLAAADRLTLDVERAARCSETLPIEGGVLELDGHCFAARDDAGTIVELAFIGDGSLEVTPPDPSEASQLRLFTGRDRLVTRFDRAVIGIGDPRLVERLVGQSIETTDRETRFAATTMYDEWHAGKDGAKRLDPLRLAAALREPGFDAYLSVWCRTPTLGWLVYQYDPDADEPVLLGRHEPADDGPGARQIWISSRPWSDRNADRVGRPAFDAEHYDIDVSLEIDVDDELEAPVAEVSARLRLLPRVEGRRLVRFALGEGPAVSRVALASGGSRPDTAAESRQGSRAKPVRAGTGVFVDFTAPKQESGPADEPSGAPRAAGDGETVELPFLHRGSTLVALLPEPATIDDPVELVVSYDGELFETHGHGWYTLSHTLGWYPLAGPHRPTFDVAFDWPAGLDLMASGRLVEHHDGEARRTARYAAERPTLGFTFELGRYDVDRMRVGEIDVTLAFTRIETKVADRVREEIAGAVRGSLEFYRAAFGSLDQSTLSVVTVPERSFAQGLAGFVTLPHSVTQGPSEPRVELVAHEVAHQWWGNLVGWESYRDQWLSEALATYSAGRFVSLVHSDAASFLTRRASDQRAGLLARDASGRTIDSLGPIVLGVRHYRNHGSGPYSALIYDKGSIVLSMLASAFDPRQFQEMLGQLARAARDREIATGSFLAAIERMSGVDLGPFADRYVYGTGLPELFYTYEIVERDGGAGWTVTGEVTRIDAPSGRLRTVQRENGGWDVVRDLTPTETVGPELVVPFQIVLQSALGPASPNRSSRGLGGHVVLPGGGGPFRIDVDEAPAVLWLDQRGELLATFHNARARPKRALRSQGDRLCASGELDRAIALYREALEAPVIDAALASTLEQPLTAREERDLGMRENALTQLGIARAELARENDAAAERAVAEAERLLDDQLGVGQAELLIVRGRLDLRAGRFGAAFARLSEALGVRGDGQIRRRRLHQMTLDAYATAEPLAQFAIAAALAGKQAVAGTAWETARDRGVDVEALARFVE